MLSGCSDNASYIGDHAFDSCGFTGGLVIPDKLTEINNAVKKYWVGADADKFVSQLKSKADAAAKKCENYKTVVETALSNDDKNFRAMQEKNTI